MCLTVEFVSQEIVKFVSCVIHLMSFIITPALNHAQRI